MGSTKKVGRAGRYSSRYGVGIRKRLIATEKKQNNLSNCPFCGFDTVKREAAGLFYCKKCSNKFAGGAYEVQTLVGKTIAKMVAQKSFLADAKLLAKENESSFSDIEREVEEALVKDKKE
ncbi:MAG: 50S ribosomal protein L37ae [Candidatus ainarchaeum sp.]|jgi:large subunit ribosomal protein L37Ae|nr:50S ribosomal protein L37ae [Candidatus ainarchaeum sp.]MDD3085556.1 50S ribosomal protein L37ae [Candidatus ainarchaeum sp.]MDD4128748.1 50S ribosomal protein L37ae [Candidatus ainarchaeum sp.]MDD4467715.1 50S ribosomal protein L37ae [Candidatus ainarchaeum sp.]